ncbi:MAG: rRNA maturation RNase YbeY [Pirellulales bacterium]|nr:rRNA maturation RNase YbeY [Pirellulales bacterium]
MITIAVADEQDRLDVDANRLRRAVRAIVRDAGLADAEISIALVDDPTIHQLNRRHLRHDYPTDVLSFLLSDEGASLEGEIIASADTACRMAPSIGWPAADELLLYVIHGALHLVGHDDRDAQSAAAMRDAERRFLSRMRVSLPAVCDNEKVHQSTASRSRRRGQREAAR